jgi:hypothetical protein
MFSRYGISTGLEKIQKVALRRPGRGLVLGWWRIQKMTGDTSSAHLPTPVYANLSEGDPRLSACAVLHPPITDQVMLEPPENSSRCAGRLEDPVTLVRDRS